MKAPFLLIVIVMLHVLVVGSVLFIQGCGTARQDAPQPPPAPVMPPDQIEGSRPRRTPKKIIPPAPDRGPSRPSVEIKTYKVREGDILSRIASKVGVSARELAELNGIDNPDMIRVGQELVLPAYAKTDGLTEHRPAPPQPRDSKPAVEPGDLYEVVAGDVLSRIAVRHGTTVSAIMELNDLDATKIMVGQKLRMPKGASEEKSDEKAAASESKPERSADRSPFETRDLDLDLMEGSADVAEKVPAPAASGDEQKSQSLFSPNDAYTYTVVAGDTVMQIAKDFVVDPQQLRKMNNLSAEDEVKPGQQILIPPANL